MKKIYSLIAAVVMAFAANAQYVDASINCTGPKWVSETNFWDWDQDASSAAVHFNNFAPGATVVLYFENYDASDAYIDFEVDSITTMYGWFIGEKADGTAVWSFTQGFNVPQKTLYPTDFDDDGDLGHVSLEVKFPADMTTTPDMLASQANEGYYMFQSKAWKNGAAYATGAAAQMNINFEIQTTGKTSNTCVHIIAPEVTSKDVVLAPNPAVKGEVVAVEGAVEVYNIAGSLVLTAVDAINTADLNAGVYFVKSGDAVAKLIVE